MSNQLAIVLGVLITLGVILDVSSNDGAFFLATAQEFLRLVELLRFWG